MLVSTFELLGNPLLELLVDLLGDARRPADDLVVDELDFLVELLSFLTFLLESDDFNVEAVQLR